MNKKTLKKKIEEILRVKNVNIEKLDYYITHDDSFFERNRNIYGSSEYWFEDVHFPEEAVKHEMKELKREYPELSPSELEERAHDQLMEDLAYWTIYFKPDHENIEAAIKSGLTPFYFHDELYLALAGCGMDLSPKLDAYQMLTTGTAPSRSSIFRHKDYFEDVVGKKTAEEALRKCKRPSPRIIISYNENKPTSSYRRTKSDSGKKKTEHDNEEKQSE